MVATVDFSSTMTAPTSLFGASGSIHGIEQGYGGAADSLWYSGGTAEFSVSGTSFVRNHQQLVTLYGSDWRDRPVWTMVNDGADGTAGRYTFTFNTYDNLDEVTDVTRYWDKLGTAPPDTRPDPSDTGFSTYYAIIGRSGAAYDNLGQQYQTIAYNEPGTIAIISNTWYDPDGNEIMSLPGGTQEFAKTVYDGLDEPTVTYAGYDPSNKAKTYAATGA